MIKKKRFNSRLSLLTEKNQNFVSFLSRLKSSFLYVFLHIKLKSSCKGEHNDWLLDIVISNFLIIKIKISDLLLSLFFFVCSILLIC